MQLDIFGGETDTETLFDVPAVPAPRKAAKPEQLALIEATPAKVRGKKVRPGTRLLYTAPEMF